MESNVDRWFQPQVKYITHCIADYLWHAGLRLFRAIVRMSRHLLPSVTSAPHSQCSCVAIFPPSVGMMWSSFSRRISAAVLSDNGLTRIARSRAYQFGYYELLTFVRSPPCTTLALAVINSVYIASDISLALSNNVKPSKCCRSHLTGTFSESSLAGPTTGLAHQLLGTLGSTMYADE